MSATSHPLSPYPSAEAREARLEARCASLGGHIHTYGTSVEGRALRAACVPALGVGVERAPRVMVCANIHGVEFIGAWAALALLEALHEGAGRQLRQRAEVWVIPCINPDGYARTWAQTGEGTLAQLRTNARGVDLNRNFPLPAPQPRWALALGGWGTGSDDPGSAFWRGEAPLSEPETRALDALMRQIEPVASANLHSTGGVVFPAHVDDAEAFATYRRLCRALRRGQRRPIGFLRLSSRTFDWFTGEMEDHQHHALGCWAVCVELFARLAQRRQARHAPSIFWRFNPRAPTSEVQADVPGLLAYLEAALERGRPKSPA